MIDINKQIAHWRDGSLEEWEVAQVILEKEHVRQALFWAHLTLEKMLKAHVCKSTGDIPPRIHNLARLSELGGLKLENEKIKFLIFVDGFNIEGRYPEYLPPAPELREARSIMKQIGELVLWLNEQL